MQTSFGDLAVVDAHAHFFSCRFFAALAASLPEPPSEEALLTKDQAAGILGGNSTRLVS